MLKRSSGNTTESSSSDADDTHVITISEKSDQTMKPIQNIDQINDRFIRRPIYFIICFFCVYFIVGILIFHLWVGFSPFNAFYFSVITLETIGYGDFVPHTQNQRLFTCFFLLIGVGFCGSFTAVLKTVLAEHEARRRKAKLNNTISRYENSFIVRDGTIMSDAESALNDSVTSIEDEHNSEFVKPALVRKDSLLAQISTSFKKATRRISTGLEVSHKEIAEANIKALKNAYSVAQEEEISDLKYRSLWSLTIISVIICFGTGCMIAIEKWDGITSAYWACVTILTVGFGDVVPKTTGGKAFTIVYVLFGCSFLAKTFQDFAQVPVVMRLKKNQNKVINQFTNDLSKQKLELIFGSEFFSKVPRLRRFNTELSKSEFVLMVLTLMNKIEANDILLVSEVFEKLDNGKGFLSSSEIEEKVANAADEDAFQKDDDLDVLDIVDKVASTVNSAATNISSQVNQAASNISSSVNNTLSRVSIALRESEVFAENGSNAPRSSWVGEIFRNRKSNATPNADSVKPTIPRKVRSRRDSEINGSDSSGNNQNPPARRQSAIIFSSNNVDSNNLQREEKSKSPARRQSLIPGFTRKPSPTPRTEIELSKVQDSENPNEWTINPLTTKSNRRPSLAATITNHAPSFSPKTSTDPNQQVSPSSALNILNRESDISDDSRMSETFPPKSSNDAMKGRWSPARRSNQNSSDQS